MILRDHTSEKRNKSEIFLIEIFIKMYLEHKSGQFHTIVMAHLVNNV